MRTLSFHESQKNRTFDVQTHMRKNRRNKRKITEFLEIRDGGGRRVDLVREARAMASVPDVAAAMRELASLDAGTPPQWRDTQVQPRMKLSLLPSGDRSAKRWSGH